MFSNYIKLALRNMAKHRLYAFINIIGLAIGLAVFLAGAVIAGYERSHDSMFVTNTSTRRINNPSAAAEVFELAPMPLASINSDGVIVVGNRAFLEFLGHSKLDSDVKLVDTKLSNVYPELEADLDRAIHGKSVKKVLNLSEGGSSEVEVALLLTAPPMECPSR